MEKWYNYKRFMIIDLDAHQGNGHARDHMDKEKYYIFDVYNHCIFPGDRYAKTSIDMDVDASRCPSDRPYLQMLAQKLPEAFTAFQPDFVVYNAGTDCMAEDPLGAMNISANGIIKRDELVFQECLTRKVPVVMVLSGGYQYNNAPCIADSITNLISKFDLMASKYQEEKKET
jgi:histone deacetylase 11